MSLGKASPWWVGEYAGARWVRADFHLHTPGVSSFSCPSGLDPRNPSHKDQILQAYVKQLHDQGIELAAITDYNGVRQQWFEPIRGEAAKYGIVVLPGAELSFGSGSAGKYGLHVLAIFDKTADPAAINQVIHSLDKNVVLPLFNDDGGHREIDPRDRVEVAVKKLMDSFSPSPVIIMAHPNDDKGLFKTMSPQFAAKFIAEVGPQAIECLEERDKERLLSTGVIGRQALDRIACVESSDPRVITEIGTKTRPSGSNRTTYLKLSTLNDIDAVALAFGDPQVMVRVGSAPETAYTRLLAAEVEGSGFLGGMRVVLSSELTNIIGGRGTGKSALLEVVRYALDVTPFAETEYRANLAKHSLGSGGKVSVWVEKHMGGNMRSPRYRIQRIYGERPRVFEVSPDGDTETAVDLHPSDAVGEAAIPFIFGQREIYSVATDQMKRIKLVDGIIGRTARDKQQEIQKRAEELRGNATDILRLQKILAEKEDMEGRLSSITHEIQLYQREGLSERLKEMTLLSADEEMLRRIIQGTDGVVTALEALETELDEYQKEADRLASQAKSSSRGLVKKASTIVDMLVSELNALIASGRGKISLARQSLSGVGREWQTARAPHDEAVRKVKQELGNQTLDPDRLDWLTREQTKLANQLEILGRAEHDRKNAITLRQEMLSGLRDARHAIFTLRRQHADHLTGRLNGQVRVAVTYRGNKSEYLNRLAGHFSGSRVDRATLEKLCLATDMPEADGQFIAEMARMGDDEFARQFGITPSRARQIVMWLTQDETRLHGLEMLAPDDAIQISMVIDGSEIPVEKLSDGQRATAVLMILLQQEDRPLIIDQPEDDLDNRFIYEGIVRLLREQKGKRQIVAATHNPNIPVLGDAELIVALGAREGKSSIQDIGSIDSRNVREAVKKIMEGGEDAFRRRARKYGAVDRGVE